MDCRFCPASILLRWVWRAAMARSWRGRGAGRAARRGASPAGPHGLDHLALDEQGRALAGDERCGDDDVHVARLLREQRHLRRDERGAHLLGVAAAALAALLDVNGQELGTQRLGLGGEGRVLCIFWGGWKGDGGTGRRGWRRAAGVAPGAGHGGAGWAHVCARACSATAARVSNTRTTAPMFLAVPMAASPATPPPITSTCAQGLRGGGDVSVF